MEKQTNNESGLYQIFQTEDKNSYEHYAALDIGSNSFHLVIARVVEGALQVVNKVKHKVRLAEGLDENNILSQAYIQKGVDTLASMTPVLQGLHHQKVRVVATYTLRRARNARAFQRAAKKVFPYPIEIVSGAEEARLIYVGISSGINTPTNKLVFDIGGGSTEFAIGAQSAPEVCKSINMGCVSYQKKFFAQGIISQKACEAAITEARQDLELASRRLKEFTWDVVYASSGTAKAIANVIHNVEAGEPSQAVTKQDLHLLLIRCIEKGNAQSLDFIGLSEERKPVFAAGICIMLAIVQSLDLSEITYSQNALREGVLLELQPDKVSQNICLNTAQSMARRYHVDTDFAHHVLQSCMQIYNQVKDTWQIDDPQLRFVLGWAALLHEVGLHINAKGIQRHSAYVLENTDMPGFNQEQQALIATLVRYHRKRVRAKDLPEFINFVQGNVEKCLAILRISLLLNMNRRQALPCANIIAQDMQSLHLIFDVNQKDSNSLFLADLSSESKMLEHLALRFSFEFQ